MKQGKFALDLQCPNCGALGVVVWQEATQPNPKGPQRRLAALHGAFHTERGRTQSGDPLIVCTACDHIQPD